MSTNLDKRWLFLTLLVLLIPILLFVYVARPAMEDSQAMAEKLEQQRRFYAEITDAAAAKNAGNAVQEKALAKLRSKVPELPYTDLILRDLRLMEVASGLHMNMYNIQPVLEFSSSGSATEVEGTQPAIDSLLPSELAVYVKPVKISTEVSGSYGQIRRMLEEIETMSRLYQVENVSFTTPTSSIVTVGVEEKQITCSISLVAYYAPDLKAIFTEPIEKDYAKPGQRSNPLY